MRVGVKIALVGGVPFFIAAAIAVAGWVLLTQEERARDGAVLAGNVYHDLRLARQVRDEYLAARAGERAAIAARFARLTDQAGQSLAKLVTVARTGEQAAQVDAARDARAQYVVQMAHLTRVAGETDALVSEMGGRAAKLVSLVEGARLRQQASNADLVRSLRAKVDSLRLTREVVAGANALRAELGEIALARATGIAATAFLHNRLRETGMRLGAALRGDDRRSEAKALDALVAQSVATEPAADAGARDATLAEWTERLLKLDTAGQRSLHDEVAQLLTYSVEANEAAQVTQNIAISTLDLAQRTTSALEGRDLTGAETLHREGGRLAQRAADLPIAPLIQGEMIEAIDGWRDRLATTIAGLKRQNETIAEMDNLASAVSAQARRLDAIFVGDAGSFGASIRQILVIGAAGGLVLSLLVAMAVARSIIVPLRRIQRDTIALAADPARGTVSGTERRDELGDIARATSVFVTEIARRERGLRRAKDQADAALHDLRQAQDDLIRAEKLASLGQLVAGVAHEINTPLGIALTTASLVRDETRTFQGVTTSGQLSRSRLTHYVDRVAEGAHLLCLNLTRAADLIHGFKQVAVDRVTDDRRRFAFDVWLDELLASLQPLLRRGGHSISRECPPELVVDTYPGILAQVITNLVTNAVVHAFADGAESRPGRIALRVSALGGSMVQVEVSDDGRGIAPTDLDRIFDPFFTTARVRGSTGLGMHIVHNLVTARLQGRIAITSESGRGTTVSFVFPDGAEVATREARSSLADRIA